MAMAIGEKKKYQEEVLPDSLKVELTGRVDTWLREGKETGTEIKPLHFEASLTADERKFVHALCESRGGEMSSKSEGTGGERHVVVYNVPVEEGVVGGVSAVQRAALTAQLEAWDREEPLHFAPGTAAEREFVHKLVAELPGLTSKSEGKEHQGADWHIVVRRG